MQLQRWWLGMAGASSVLIVGASLMRSARVAPAIAGFAFAGLMAARLYAMSPRWALRPARGDSTRSGVQ